MPKRKDRKDQRDHRNRCGRKINLQRDFLAEGKHVPHGYTITLPSSVIASSTLSPASPKIISLCGRPEGIIGKQFSFGSTIQSKITGLSTLIMARIASSSSA